MNIIDVFIGYLLLRFIALDIFAFTGDIVDHAMSPTTDIVISVFDRLCDTVKVCVLDYFETFRFCWGVVFFYMDKMIEYYIDYLGELTRLLTAYPMSLIGIAGVAICLFFVSIIIYLLTRFLFNNNTNREI